MYAGVPRAFLALFRATLGDFKFEALQDANWLLGPTLFTMFVVLVSSAMDHGDGDGRGAGIGMAMGAGRGLGWRW